jgi:hypothetical protein
MACSDRLLAFNHQADSERHAAGWPRQFCRHVLQMATAATNRIAAGAVACRYCCADSHSVLKDLEAAIGIEPNNKGSAVRPGPLSLSVMEDHCSKSIHYSGLT